MYQQSNSLQLIKAEGYKIIMIIQVKQANNFTVMRWDKLAGQWKYLTVTNKVKGV